MKDINERLAAELADSVVPFGDFDSVIDQIAANIKADHENPEATDEAEYQIWENAVPVDIPMDVEEAAEAGDEDLTTIAKGMMMDRAEEAYVETEKRLGR